MPRLPVVLGAALALVALSTPACRSLRSHLPSLHRDRAPEAPKPIDLNTARLSKIEALPGITPSMARRIVDGRPYDDLGDLVGRGILTDRELLRIQDRVTVQKRSKG